MAESIWRVTWIVSFWVGTVPWMNISLTVLVVNGAGLEAR